MRTKDAIGTRLPREAQTLFWLRGEISRAHEQWPDLIEHADTDDFYRDRELANRRHCAAGISRIVMVPLTVASLLQFAVQTDTDPTDETTRRAYLRLIVDEGGTVIGRSITPAILSSIVLRSRRSLAICSS